MSVIFKYKYNPSESITVAKAARGHRPVVLATMNPHGVAYMLLSKAKAREMANAILKWCEEEAL